MNACCKTSLVLYRSAAVVAAGLIAGAVHSALVPVKVRPDEPPPIVLPPKQPEQTQQQQGSQAAVAPQPEPEKIGLNLTLEQSKQLFDAGKFFVDARHLEEYEKGHVENAFWMNAEHFLGGSVPEAINFLDPGDVLVVYCGGGACDASKNLVTLLQLRGFKQARIFEDGYPAWEKAGYPTATGKPPVGAE
jgi:rhodanese-related sulfurtransferase